jgi:hypothetical protein
VLVDFLGAKKSVGDPDKTTSLTTALADLLFNSLL